MALTVISPTNSFVRFGETPAEPLCIWGTINYCLPVYDQEDVYFQFVVQGTESEIDSLCTQAGDEIEVSIVTECNTTPLLIFGNKPERYRLSETQVLYNWSHGLPGFSSVITVGQCFKVQIEISTIYATLTACTNCFERIANDCFTSVIEYGNDEDAFGFKYCLGGNISGGGTVDIDCSPTVVTFVSVPTLTIPYTALLQSKYGVFPTVQVWIYDGSGQLLNMGITAGFDTYPPNNINLDFGGNASGIVVIR